MILSFLNFWGLLGILAVCVPLYIHFMRVHRVVADVPSLFLFTKNKRSRRQRVLNDLLLLLLRCLIVILISLLLAMPILRTRLGDDAFDPRSSAVAILLDDSTRGALTQNRRGVLSAALEHAKRFLRALPPEAEVFLGFVSSGTATVPLSPAEATDMLERVCVQPVVSSPGASFQRLLARLRSHSRFPSALFLYAGIPDKDFAESPELRAEPDVVLHLFLSPDPNGIDPYIVSSEWQPENKLRVRFSGSADRLALARVRVTARSDGRSMTHALTGEQASDAEARISLSALDFSGGVTLLLQTRDGSSADAEASHAASTSSSSGDSVSLAECFVAPPESKNTARSVLILHDNSRPSRYALVLLHAALASVLSVECKMYPCDLSTTDPALYSDTRYTAVVLLPLARRPNGLEALLGGKLDAGSRLILFPQSANRPLQLPGLPSKTEPEWGPTLPLPPDSFLRMSHSDSSTMDYLGFYEKGLSRTRISHLAPMFPAPRDKVLFTADSRPVLLERESPSGALFLFAIPFEPVPAALFMNPVFPVFLHYLVFGSSSGSTASTANSRGRTLVFPDFIPGLSGDVLFSGPGGFESRFQCRGDNQWRIYPDKSGFATLRVRGKDNFAVFALNEPRPTNPPLTRAVLDESARFRHGVTDFEAMTPIVLHPGGRSPLESEDSSASSVPEEAALSFADLIPLVALVLAFVFAFETFLTALLSIRKKAVLS